MARIWLLSLVLALPGLALGQSHDERLAGKVSIRQEYLPLADLAKFVEKKTGVRVVVDRAIEDRKVSIFCDDCPIGEVMERVATTLSMEWAPEDGGRYRLRLLKGVAKEEDAIAAHEAELAAQVVRRKIQKRADLVQSSVDELQDEFDKLNALRPILGRDQSPEGRAKLKEADDRFQDLWTFSYNHQEWDDGYAMKQMTSDQIDSLMSGQTIFASTKPRPGMLLLPASALTRAPIGTIDPKATAPTEMLLYMRYDPLSKNLTINHREMGGGCRGGGIDGLNDPSVLQELAKEPLVKRLTEWGKPEDTAVLDAPLNREAQPPKAGPYKVYTFADNLLWLHEKTGVPIVADAFHRFASFDNVTSAPTIRAWLAAFNDVNRVNQSWAPARARSEGGWLMLRHRRYWRFLPSEVPQGVLAPLEDKYLSGESLTVMDLATFAAALTPAQASDLNSFVAMVPLNPVVGNVEILSLWKSLSSRQQEAAAHDGLSLGQMSSESRQLYDKTFSETLWNGFLDESVLPYFFPGGPPLPNGMSLFYEDTSMGLQIGGPDNFAWPRMGTTVWGSIPYAGARFKIGLFPDSKVMYEIQVHPLATH